VYNCIRFGGWKKNLNTTEQKTAFAHLISAKWSELTKGAKK
jgi:hypothetical protein